MWLQKIYVRNCHHIRELEIDLRSKLDHQPRDRARQMHPKFRHLILTGPNGSGKSSVLNAIHFYICLLHGDSLDSTPNCVAKGDWIGSPPTLHERLVFTGLFSPRRIRDFAEVSSPSDLSSQVKALGPQIGIGDKIEQVLVNRRVEQAFKKLEGLNEEAELIETWFSNFLNDLRSLFQNSLLELRFDSRDFRYRVNIGNGNWTNFNNLAEGHRYLLAIFADLFSRAELLPFRQKYNELPPGVILIDEPECHLHLELQATIMPFLSRSFPSIQFIVATHSPLVVTSLANATILDLRNRDLTDSSEVSGTRFGDIVTNHFGLNSEYSIETSAKLSRLGLSGK